MRIADDILLCHGTPASDLEYLLEDEVGDGVILSSAEAIARRLDGDPAGLVLCGHSHIPRVSRSIGRTGATWIVNPGSVGLPAYDFRKRYVESGDPHARYAIIDWERGSARVELIAVEYDWYAASRDAATNGRLEWAHALATGYALRDHSV